MHLERWKTKKIPHICPNFMSLHRLQLKIFHFLWHSIFVVTFVLNQNLLQICIQNSQILLRHTQFHSDFTQKIWEKICLLRPQIGRLYLLKSHTEIKEWKNRDMQRQFDKIFININRRKRSLEMARSDREAFSPPLMRLLRETTDLPSSAQNRSVLGKCGEN